MFPSGLRSHMGSGIGVGWGDLRCTMSLPTKRSTNCNVVDRLQCAIPRIYSRSQAPVFASVCARSVPLEASCRLLVSMSIFGGSRLRSKDLKSSFMTCALGQCLLKAHGALSSPRLFQFSAVVPEPDAVCISMSRLQSNAIRYFGPQHTARCFLSLCLSLGSSDFPVACQSNALRFSDSVLSPKPYDFPVPCLRPRPCLVNSWSHHSV